MPNYTDAPISGPTETRHEFFKRRLKELGLYDKDSDYDGMIGQCVEELSEVLSKHGYSGQIIVITHGVFTQLLTEWMG